MKTAWPAMLVAAALTLAACSSPASDNPTIGGGAVGQISDVTMQAVNGGQSGAAKLSESPSVVLTVTISLQSATGSQRAEQPASIPAAPENLKPGWTFVCYRREVPRSRYSRRLQRMKITRMRACARPSKEKPEPLRPQCRGCETE